MSEYSPDYTVENLVIIGSGPAGYTAAIYAVPVVIIFAFIVINRSQYTNNIRDQRYWNRENRPKNASALQIALCPKMPQAEQTQAQ
jgi:hypothetical protein